jgi:hypothetical protein
MSRWLPISGAVIHSWVGCLDQAFALLPTRRDWDKQLLTEATAGSHAQGLCTLIIHSTPIKYILTTYYVRGPRKNESSIIPALLRCIKGLQMPLLCPLKSFPICMVCVLNYYIASVFFCWTSVFSEATGGSVSSVYRPVPSTYESSLNSC